MPEWSNGPGLGPGSLALTWVRVLLPALFSMALEQTAELEGYPYRYGHEYNGSLWGLWCNQPVTNQQLLHIAQAVSPGSELLPVEGWRIGLRVPVERSAIAFLFPYQSEVLGAEWRGIGIVSEDRLPAEAVRQVGNRILMESFGLERVAASSEEYLRDEPHGFRSV